MARTIVIANQKGGIGKSTSALNISRALSELEQRVLMIDLDPQGGLSAAIGVDSFNVRRSVYALLMQGTDTSVHRLIRTVGPNLALIPASLELARAEIQLATHQDRTIRLRNALARQRPAFDFIVIDTPPTLGILTANGLTAAQELLIPVQAQYLAMRGVRALLDVMKRVARSANPDIHLLGVFATMYNDTSTHSAEVVEELKSAFGSEFWGINVPLDDVVAEAPVNGQALMDYAPNHPAAAAYRAIATEILKRGETST